MRHPILGRGFEDISERSWKTQFSIALLLAFLLPAFPLDNVKDTSEAILLMKSSSLNRLSYPFQMQAQSEAVHSL